MGKAKDLPIIEVSQEEIVNYLKISEQFAQATIDVLQRKLSVMAAKREGIEVSDTELQISADAFRVDSGLDSAADTERWLEENDISSNTFEEYIETNILIDKLMDILEKSSDSEKYVSTPHIRNHIRDMIYEEWLKEQKAKYRYIVE